MLAAADSALAAVLAVAAAFVPALVAVFAAAATVVDVPGVDVPVPVAAGVVVPAVLFVAADLVPAAVVEVAAVAFGPAVDVVAVHEHAALAPSVASKSVAVRGSDLLNENHPAH